MSDVLRLFSDKLPLASHRKVALGTSYTSRETHVAKPCPGIAPLKYLMLVRVVAEFSHVIVIFQTTQLSRLGRVLSLLLLDKSQLVILAL